MCFRGEALGAAEMRLEPALRHLLLVLGRHARDDGHHALGRKFVNELQLRLVESGCVQRNQDKSLTFLRAFKRLELDQMKSLPFDGIPCAETNDDHRRLFPPASELEIGAKKSGFNRGANVQQF